MEEDAEVKAPVTRLRRRVSVEQTEDKSPAVNTPTKKRGGRRTVKTDLELIDENMPDNTTTKKNTRKTAAKDIIDAVEEKPVTPSRRSTRIKSNTSIVSETTIAVDSPRAKRAARRTSQIGSDTEAPLTPARQTRRTRKDSTSSIEKNEIQAIIKPAIQISEVISEEPENNLRKSFSNTDTSDSNNSPTHIRKSPRLVEKIKKRHSFETDKKHEEQVNNVPNENKESLPSKKLVESPITNSGKTTQPEQTTKKDRLSQSSSDLIKNLNTEKKIASNLNKSTTSLEKKGDVETKRVRTKSWNHNTAANEANFFSDNESRKKKKKKENKIPIIQIDKLGTGDSLSTSLDLDKSISKKKKINSCSFVVEDIDISLANTSNKSQEKNKIDKSLLPNQNKIEQNDNVPSKLFENDPSNGIQTVVFIEDDSDSNSGKIVVQQKHESGDQCVPVVEHPNQKGSPTQTLPDKKELSFINKSKSVIMNDSCEPMDVDETIPENLQISQIKCNDNNSSQRKSLPFQHLNISETGKEKLNKSKRKSSISNTPNKTENENKSTLILSQLKDSSTGEIDNVVKSPQIKNSILSKTVDDLNTTQENEGNKKNLSLSCVTTSTPLQQKRLKLGNINTSIITNNEIEETQKILNETNNKNHSNAKNDNMCLEENYQEQKENISSASNTKPEINRSTSSSKNVSSNKKSKKNNKDSSIAENAVDVSKSGDKSLINKQNKKSKNSENQKSISLKSKSDDSDEEMNSNDEMDSDNEMGSDDEAEETSNMLDDVAEDAGDDYESGDSLDEGERKYLKENEILEKGETLSTEDELSNDSDYEKDSFVVSSDPEDNELLDGTDDDLSLSDNELKMTTKSKKKYDERKDKEAKKASREMFESRHKLNSSNKSNSSDIGKTKKHKRQQFSSSESEEEEEVEIKTKKSNRMRLDSSHDASMMEEKNESKILNKRNKRLSNSICKDNLNEKEITICNETVKDNDPLADIKLEPNTPQANESISFLNADTDLNNDSELTRTQTELVDPLDDSMGEDSMSSDNENIMQNYDSVLEGLNKSKTKTKVCDISLNIEKKKSKKERKTIVDELNLTHVKSVKKTKTKQADKKQNESATAKKASKQNGDDDDSSDSIDLHLLFSEDSTMSDDVQNKKNSASTSDEQFIPLKKSEGKTNLRENADEPGSSLGFYIDTEGEHNKSASKSFNTSLKNNKILYTENDDDDNSVSKDNESKDKIIKENKEESVENSDSDAPMDVPFKKEKAVPVKENGDDETDFAGDKSINKSVAKTPVSEKKKKKARQSQNMETIENENTNVSMNLSLSSAKKKRKSISEATAEIEQDTSIPLNKSLNNTPGSNKKKMSEPNTNIDEEIESEEQINKSINKTPKSAKKKNKNSVSTEDPTEIVEEKPCNISINKTPNSTKKIQQNSQSEDQIDNHEKSSDKSFNKTPKNSKKKKQNSLSTADQNVENEDSILNVSQIKTPDKQTKKKMSMDLQTNEQTEISEVLKISEIPTPGSQKKKGKDLNDEGVYEQNVLGSAKKNKKTHTDSFTAANESTSASADHVSNDTSTNKRKRKSSNVPVEESIPKADLNASKLNESVVSNQKKKRKTSQNNQSLSNDASTSNNQNEPLVGNKKRKLSQSGNVDTAEHAVEVKSMPSTSISETELRNRTETNDVGKKNKGKKRKEREDDDSNNIVKVLKENSFDKVHVPRLPANILNQLEDKPQQAQTMKSKVISTSNFSVDETKKRRNKPSNYLEESIYLNDDDIESKNKKKRLLKPKVLPFVPTALTSACGYTTNFKVNVLSNETKFVAQSDNVTNFKNDYLFNNKKIKRQGTYELYKRNRNMKISKF